jgi:hypothetical protein
MTEPMMLLIHSAKQVVQVATGKERVLVGTQMKNVRVFSAKANDGISIVAAK